MILFKITYSVSSGTLNPAITNWHVTWCVKGVMVRLMLVLAPVMCILSGIAVSSTLTTYMKNLDVSHKDKKSRRQDSSYPAKNEASLKTLSFCRCVLLLCIHAYVHSSEVISYQY